MNPEASSRNTPIGATTPSSSQVQKNDLTSQNEKFLDESNQHRPIPIKINNAQNSNNYKENIISIKFLISQSDFIKCSDLQQKKNNVEVKTLRLKIIVISML